MLVAAACLGLAACTGGGDADKSAQSTATLAPGTVFKDALIVAAVKAKLAAGDIDSTTRVRVGAHDGRVILVGKVPTEAERKSSVGAAATVEGVTGVDDRLTVGNAGPSTAKEAGDLGLTATVEGALAAQTGVNVTDVRVKADGGTVTLTGRVATAAIKSTMLQAAKSAPGVRNVVDRIAVK
jgi:osmotically-inducible protein OsmY